MLLLSTILIVPSKLMQIVKTKIDIKFVSQFPAKPIYVYTLIILSIALACILKGQRQNRIVESIKQNIVRIALG
ncbi:MAG: hypothetical protein EOP41_01300 [Sphingobacteriaceae bacterium]|nr:MAG: hypothetical protein EOP41_01300 [Sphingobacteriaceae bacterium]